MSILSGIKLVSKSGMYGKLIGVGKKSGIKVFEKIDEYGAKHITSVGRDGNVRKKVLKSGEETVVNNLITGERVNISKGRTTYSMRRLSKDGLVEHYFREPDKVDVWFGEGWQSLHLQMLKDKYAGKLFSMSNPKKVNLNGTEIPAGATLAEVNKDGKINKIVKDVYQPGAHNKDLVQSVYDAVSKLLKL